MRALIRIKRVIAKVPTVGLRPYVAAEVLELLQFGPFKRGTVGQRACRAIDTMLSASLAGNKGQLHASLQDERGHGLIGTTTGRSHPEAMADAS